MSNVLSTLEEALTALNAEYDSTPETNAARRKKLWAMSNRIERLWQEAYALKKKEGK
jgi:hypothetical protein